MNYKIILICFFLLVPLMYAQNIGIGLDAPTEKLDVKGSIKLREIRESNSKEVTPLYFDSNGVFGKKDETGLVTHLFTNRETKFSIYGYSMHEAYNKEQIMISPLLMTNTTNNTLEITQPSLYNFKIKSEGYYQYSASTHLHFRTNGNGNVFDVLAKIEKSIDNGSTWQIITACRMQGLGGFMSNIQGIFPTAVTHHNAGDLIRMSYSRVKDSNGKLIGASNSSLLLLSDNGGMDGYNLLILKL